MLRIDGWFGRFGNNILQVVNCLFYAEQRNYTAIMFPPHPFFTQCIIQLNGRAVSQNHPVSNSFYFLHEIGLRYPSPGEMRRLAQTYILPIFAIRPPPSQLKTYIHLRGGDVFGGNHIPNEYVQPPLDYYIRAVGTGNVTGMVYEDRSNPCVDKLLNNTSIVSRKTRSLEGDISELLSAEVLVCGFGTFAFAIYLLSARIREIYIPADYVNKYLTGDWGDVKVHLCTFPGYIHFGGWKNTPEQRQLMTEYVWEPQTITNHPLPVTPWYS